jgi:DNA-binding response OmpR family regulator
MIMCLGDLPQSAVIERYFQERGWKVVLAETGGDARRLVQQHGAGVALLAEEPPFEESGWLTCWKLLSEAPGTQVVVVGTSETEQGERQAEIVGAAAYVHADEPASSIFRTLQAIPGSVI